MRVELEVLCMKQTVGRWTEGSIVSYHVVDNGKSFKWGKKECPPRFFCLHITSVDTSKATWLGQVTNYVKYSAALDDEGVPIILSSWPSRLMVDFASLPPAVQTSASAEVATVSLSDFSAALYCPEEERLLTTAESSALWASGDLDGWVSFMHS